MAVCAHAGCLSAYQDAAYYGWLEDHGLGAESERAVGLGLISADLSTSNGFRLVTRRSAVLKAKCFADARGWLLDSDVAAPQAPPPLLLRAVEDKSTTAGWIDGRVMNSLTVMGRLP